jgi:hypothetical protein
MERIAKVTFKILLIGLSLFLLWLTFSCAGSKSKLIQKTQFSTEIAKVERVSELSQNDIQTDLMLNASSQTLTTNENENVEADIDDPSKEFELNSETKDGKTKYSGKNIKNLKVVNEKETKKSKDTTSLNQSEIDRSKSSKDTEASTDIDTSGNGEIINKQKDGKFPWWWLIVIVLAIIVYIWIGKLKKTYMPWKWFTS